MALSWLEEIDRTEGTGRLIAQDGRSWTVDFLMVTNQWRWRQPAADGRPELGRGTTHTDGQLRFPARRDGFDPTRAHVLQLEDGRRFEVVVTNARDPRDPTHFTVNRDLGSAHLSVV